MERELSLLPSLLNTCCVPGPGLGAGGFEGEARGLGEELEIDGEAGERRRISRGAIGLPETYRQRNSMGKGGEAGKLRVFCRARG